MTGEKPDYKAQLAAALRSPASVDAALQNFRPWRTRVRMLMSCGACGTRSERMTFRALSATQKVLCARVHAHAMFLFVRL